LRNPNINRAALFDLSRNDGPNQEVEKMSAVRKVFLSRTSIFSLVATALLVATTATRADTATVVCHVNSGLVVEETPTTVDLNESQNSVTMHFGQTHWDPRTGMSGSTPSSGEDWGPITARFDANTITWGDQIVYTLNRVTGVLTDSSAHQVWNCQKAQKQF